MKSEAQARVILGSAVCRPKLREVLFTLLGERHGCHLWAENDRVPGRDPEWQRQIYVFNKLLNTSCPMLYTVENAIIDAIAVAQFIGMSKESFKDLGDVLDGIGNL